MNHVLHPSETARRATGAPAVPPPPIDFIDSALVPLTALVVLAAPFLLWRQAENGWPLVYLIQLVLALLLVAMTLYRRRLSAVVKTGAVSSLALSIGIVTLYANGLIAPVVAWVFALALFLVGMSFPRRIFLSVAIVVPAASSIIGVGFVTGVLTTARKLIDTIARSILYNDQRLELGASIGIAVFPDHGRDRATLRHRADAAMFAVKGSGKNDYAFAESL